MVSGYWSAPNNNNQQEVVFVGELILEPSVPTMLIHLAASMMSSVGLPTP